MKAAVFAKEKLAYPWIGESFGGGFIVLFTEPSAGVTLVSSRDPMSNGRYYSNWCEDDFRPFAGEITLSNY